MITVAEDTSELETIYHYGQNDLCTEEDRNQRMPSVSMGDLIEANDKYFLVKGFGFEELTQDKVDAYFKARKQATVEGQDELVPRTFYDVFERLTGIDLFFC